MKNILLLLLFASPLTAQLVGDQQSGLASYYSTEYDGAETAYGTLYNRNELVAAHKLYPFNSRVRVRNTGNDRVVTVRIIDKGPFIRGRVIELSERAARELGMLGERTAPVELTLLSLGGAAPEPPAAVREEAPPLPEPIRSVRPATEAPSTAPRPVDPPAVREQTTPPPPPQPAKRAPRVARFGPGTYRIELRKPRTGNFAVQVASLGELERALDKVAELQGRYFDDVLLRKVVNGKSFIYKVLLGPFPDEPSARNYASDLKQRYGIAGFPVALDAGTP